MVKTPNLQSLAKVLVSHFQKNKKEPKKAPLAFIGFDGFTDELVRVVSSRRSFDDYDFYKSIKPFGEKIVDAAGQSCNLELVVQMKKLGGNAPIMTNALLEGGHRIIFAGPIGTKNEIEPLFQSMADGCEKVFPMGPSAHSDALEFSDGKVILGKMGSLRNVTFENLLKLIPLKNLITLLDKTDLFASTNWTMLPTMNDMWEQILSRVVPHLSEKPRWMFVDLADPAKRTDKDLKEAIKLLEQLKKGFKVVLGLNYAESCRMGSVLGKTCKVETEKSLEETAIYICQKAKLNLCVIHATKFAVASNGKESWKVAGPYTSNPEFSTGAGDNFNAGFCNALLCDCTIEDCLISGVYTSGFYVRKGHSPSIKELANFLKT